MKENPHLVADPFMLYRTLLAAHHIRVTPQRLVILRVIGEGGGHVTVEAISKRIAAEFPAIHQGTIYRTLDTLRMSGLVTETHMGDRAAVYELPGVHHHHHLVCERCGGITEVEDALITPVRSAVFTRYGFQARADHMAIFGICRDCANNDASS